MGGLVRVHNNAQPFHAKHLMEPVVPYVGQGGGVACMDTFHQLLQGSGGMLWHAIAGTDALCFPHGHTGGIEAVTQCGQV